jgi:hypothetical protein
VLTYEQKIDVALKIDALPYLLKAGQLDIPKKEPLKK